LGIKRQKMKEFDIAKNVSSECVLKACLRLNNVFGFPWGRAFPIFNESRSGYNIKFAAYSDVVDIKALKDEVADILDYCD